MDIVREDLKRKRQQKRLSLSIAAAALVVALGIFVATLEPAAPTVERAALYIDTVQRGDMLLEVRGPGVLVPREIRWIAAATEARVDRVLVKPGAMVEPDTVLVQMSNPELVQQVVEARAAVTAGEADFAALKVQLQSEVLDQRAVVAAARAEYEGARLEADAQEELADEPTGNLDSKNGDAVMKLLDELHADGATICMVTHDPRFAECAKRKIAMFDGQVVDEETMEELREHAEIRVGA